MHRVADGAGGSSSAHGDRCLLVPCNFPRGRLALTAGHDFKRGMAITTGTTACVSYHDGGGVLDIFNAPDNCRVLHGGRTILAVHPSCPPTNICCRRVDARWPEGSVSGSEDDGWTASDELRSGDGYNMAGEDGGSIHGGDTGGTNAGAAHSRTGGNLPRESAGGDHSIGHGLLRDGMYYVAAGAALLRLLGGYHQEEVTSAAQILKNSE